MGEMEATSRNVAPEQIVELRGRLEILIRADRKATERVAKARERYNRQIAATFRPAHRRAVQRVHRALLELEAANSEEQAVRAVVPGASLQAMTFPNLGSSGAAGGPLRYWLEFARRLGFLEEDAADWPAAAL